MWLFCSGEALGERVLHLRQGALRNVAGRRHAHLEAPSEHNGKRAINVAPRVRPRVEPKHARGPRLQRGESELVEPVLGIV